MRQILEDPGLQCLLLLFSVLPVFLLFCVFSDLLHEDPGFFLWFSSFSGLFWVPSSGGPRVSSAAVVLLLLA